MNFFKEHRDKFCLTAIFSSLFFNFFMIYASWADDDNAWTTAFIIAGIAILSGLVCQFTQAERTAKSH